MILTAMYNRLPMNTILASESFLSPIIARVSFQFYSTLLAASNRFLCGKCYGISRSHLNAFYFSHPSFFPIQNVRYFGEASFSLRKHLEVQIKNGNIQEVKNLKNALETKPIAHAIGKQLYVTSMTLTKKNELKEEMLQLAEVYLKRDIRKDHDRYLRKIYLQLGKLHKNKCPDSAIHYYNLALKHGIKEANRLGQSLVKIDPEKAHELFGAILQSALEDINFAVNLLYSSKKDQDTYIAMKDAYFIPGIKQYSALINSKPTYIAYFYRGICYEALGDFSQAIQDYRQALTLFPFLPQCYHALARLGYRTEKYKEIGNNLKYLLTIPQFAQYSESHKMTLLKFLCSEDKFILKEAYIHSMDDHGICLGTLINRNSSIKTFSLSGCHLNDQALEAIGKCLRFNRSIAVLRLGWNSLVTDKGILHLAAGMTANKQLKEIYLDKCHAITVSSIAQLIEKAPRQLQVIGLHQNMALRGQGLDELASNRGIKIIWDEI